MRFAAGRDDGDRSSRAVTAFHLFAGVATLAALAAYVNHRWLGLPTGIALMLSSLAASAMLIAGRALGWLDLRDAERLVESMRFDDLVLHVLLAFLLFAGALQTDLARLRREAWAVGLLASLGVVIGTAVAGLLFWWTNRALSIEMGFAFALVFGAVIAPTDPLAVLGILRKAGVPRPIEMKIVGESLFNDGVSIVVFGTLLEIATAPSSVTPGGTLTYLLREVGGALAFGACAGYAACTLLRGIDEPPVEVLMTLAAAVGGYSAAEVLGISAPITVVVAGLVIGNPGRARAMSSNTRLHVDTFWDLVDYLVNALLFLMLGFEVLTIDPSLLLPVSLALAALSVPISLAARFVGVAIPLALLRSRKAFPAGTTAMLTWGGLRGGVSLALALSLPSFAGRERVLAATYAIVVFSVLVQGFTIPRVVKRVAA